MHPPLAEELGNEIVLGFGGAEVLLERAEQVLLEKRYNLAAKLAAYALADNPDNPEARQIKATALRKMAQATPTGIQTRNFLLHEALELEGKIAPVDSKAIGRIPLPLEAVAAMPPASLFGDTGIQHRRRQGCRPCSKGKNRHNRHRREFYFGHSSWRLQN